MNKPHALILWFEDVNNDDVALVGGKNASLGEMYTKLTSQGIRIPNGFIVTSLGYRRFVEHNHLNKFLADTLKGLNTSDIKDLQKRGKKIRKAFIEAKFPKELTDSIEIAYNKLSKEYGKRDVDTAVRSSATAEDLPGASFAGQHETFLNVRGNKNVLLSIKKAFASLFTDRAISYRVDKGFEYEKISLSVCVQKMVRSDIGSSGVIFTLDTETGFRDVVTVTSSWGLGEMVVQGKVTPDEFLVFKPTLDKGYRPIIKKVIGPKNVKMIYNNNGRSPVKEIRTSQQERIRFSISDDEIIQLAKWAVQIEKHYSERSGKPMPMDLEWAKDGERNELYIVQARPETVESEKKGFIRKEYHLIEEGEVVSEGISVGTKIANGLARVILSTDKLNQFKEGEILVTEITDPDWEPIMKKASAIITEKGGRTSHAAIVSRELGIPAIVGASKVLQKIKTGDKITIDTTSGDVGKIYKGLLKFEKKEINLENLPSTRTKIALNVGTPDGAFSYSSLPHHGVGLAREEFIIASKIRVHPLALIYPEKVTSEALRNRIKSASAGYKNGKEFFVNTLAQGIGQIAAAFAPHQVIVRFSDFKTNEYRALLGGKYFEPEEENPMIGWRGASRYAHPDFRPAFELECQAVHMVREEYGLRNLKAMIPFCRTPEEGRKVLEIMKEQNLWSGPNDDDLKIYVMCEIPSNVLRADEFLDIFDGFSIGSNDLAQLTLGLDRDSAIVAGISNENDPAVLELVKKSIEACKRRGKYIGICGQAPSDYPDFLRFLVRNGIETISLSPDSVLTMVFEIAEEEKNQ